MSDTKRLSVIIYVALWCLLSLAFDVRAQGTIDLSPLPEFTEQKCEPVELATNIMVIKKKMLGSVPAAPECSGNKGNTATTDLGATMSDATNQCFVYKITDACAGGIVTSMTLRVGWISGSGAGTRACFVVYADNSGVPGALLGYKQYSGSEVYDASSPFTWVTESGMSVSTSSSTIWIGWCGEASMTGAYSSTSGGPTKAIYGCTAAVYNNPPADWGSLPAGCAADSDWNTTTPEVYVTY